MELFLLDTTEKEGEDNKLYHYSRHHHLQSSSSTDASSSSSWRDLRGVLAAAVGTTSSVCGEPLQRAHFKSSSSTASSHPDSDEGTGVVGFVNLYEVLYVLVFPPVLKVPMPIVRYYTRSSCDLMLSVFGYPAAKLSEWKKNNSSEADLQLKERLDEFFLGVEPRCPAFLRYFVVHDRLRDVIIGESFQECCLDHLNTKAHQSSVSAQQKAAHATIFSLFVDRVAAFQQMYQSSEPPKNLNDAKVGSLGCDPDLPTWIAPVKLDVDDPNTLFLHEKSSDTGADISSEDAHIFPPPGETLFTTPEAQQHGPGSLLANRLVHQDAEPHFVASTGQRLWIVTNYYETVNLFAIFDAELVTLDTIEQQMDRVCTFGGYTSTDEGSQPN